MTSTVFTPTFGHRYTFVVSATDYVSNTGQASAATDAVQVTKYYYIGSSRVAMRQTNAVSSTVTYLHTDHLGTVSIATNGGGQLVARTLNMPYGGVRWSSGSMPTDYGFTGMKDDTYIKLIQMGARWYDPQIGRWISPDTIVPDPVKPQQYNRFSYVGNNPLKFIDPTGYCGEGSTPGEGVSQEHHDLLCKLHDEALRLSGLVKKGSLTDVEALAMLLEFAAPFYAHSYTSAFGFGVLTEYDEESFVYDLGIVVGGLEVNPLSEWLPGVIEQFFARAGLPTPQELQDLTSYQMLQPNDPNSVFGQYYVGFEAFGTTGFAPAFHEEFGNQVRHFFGGMAGGMAYFGAGRERLLGRESPGSADYNLHLKAFELVDSLNVNTANGWAISNLANEQIRREYRMPPWR